MKVFSKAFKKRFLSCLLVIVLSVSLFGVSVAGAETSEKKIVIIHTNDTHSRVSEGKYDGMGFAKIAAYVKQYKAQNPNTLVLDAGDTFHGQTFSTLVKGESIVTVMNAVGYDAMTPGNHDFNYGYKRLLELKDLAKFPLLSANIKKADSTRLLTPYIIKEIDGVKVGIFGLSTPETTYKTHPDNVAGLTFANPVEEAKAIVAEMKGKADVVVALSHLGMDASSTDTSSKVAAEVEGIDVIVDGHSHTVLEAGKLEGKTLIVSTGEYDKNLGIVELTIKNGSLADKKASLISKEEAAKITEDADVAKIIADIKAGQGTILSEKVGKTAVDLEGERARVRTGETNLGNLITDAMLNTTGADVAITNGGGIRAPIKAGDITKGDIITVLPFGNYIVTKKVKGSDIKAALEIGAKAYPEENGAFSHVGGMTYTIDASKAVGERVTGIKVKGVQLDMDKEYMLATNDFMAAGGDGYTMFADDKIVNEYPALDEAVISYMQAKGTVEPKLEGRISVINIKPKEEAKPAEVKPAEPKPVEPKPVEAKPAEVKAPEAKSTEYVVKEGDMLWKIAKQFGTTWQKLQEMNKLKNPDLIHPGQKLAVPAK